MTFDSSHFSYLNPEVTDGLTVELPRGLASEDAVLDALAESLQFPDYFGRNWNALDECLCDLEWLDGHQIVLVHRELPALALEPLHTYLSVLSDAVAFWQHDGARALTVVFPESARGELELVSRYKPSWQA